jgi:hypothetical protein
VNGQHFRTLLWLRWRLRVNQLKRGGLANAIILGLLAVAAVGTALILFLVSFLIGLFVLGTVPTYVLLFVWDGLVIAFLISWMIGLLTDLQRSEVLSLEKFLHMPVSLTSAFLINYFSSFFSVTLLFSVPVFLGLALGLVGSRGPALLLSLPLLAAFLLMVTALTYQFQGWLASLMVNKRRRRTITVVMSAVVLVVCQVPNLINIFRPHPEFDQQGLKALNDEEMAAVNDAAKAKAKNPEVEQEIKGIHAHFDEIRHQRAEQQKASVQQLLNQVEQTSRIASLVLPPGWLPLGIEGLAGGSVLPALLGTLGLGLLGTASLWRGYRTTLRLYTGEFSSGKVRRIVQPAGKVVAVPARLLECELPWIPAQAAAIALAEFRCLMRAPEVKMLILAPLLMVVIFGGILWRSAPTVPEVLRTLMAFGAVTLVLFMMTSLLGNQFGLDRSGFRLFVLCACPRRHILLGKNLSVAPVALGMGWLLVAFLQVLYPMRLDHLAAILPQSIAMYLLFCMLANALSMLTPMALAPGTLKPTNMKGLPLLLQLVFLFLFPLALTPALLPLGIEFALEQLGWTYAVPICLLLSLGGCAGVIYLYRQVLTMQGTMLEAREQRILDIVAPKAE